MTGLVLLVVAAWIVVWPALVLALAWPPAIVAIAWVIGLVVAVLLVRGTRDRRRHRDPVSRLEARSLARDRYEQDRLRRLRAQRGFVLEEREREADERIEARVRDLVARSGRPTDEPDPADVAARQDDLPGDAPGP